VEITAFLPIRRHRLRFTSLKHRFPSPAARLPAGGRDSQHNEPVPMCLKSPKHGADTSSSPVGAHVRSHGSGGGRVVINNVQRLRENLMMSKAELARKAGLSTLTIDRVEAGRPCRLDTKRKILLALGFKVSEKDRVFGALASDQQALTTLQTSVSIVDEDPRL